jgi:hypothetical protein
VLVPTFPAMLSRAASSGFIEPCLPSPADRPPSGSNWIHEIKHDGYRLMTRRDSVAPTIDGPRATETGEQGTNALARHYWNGGAAPRQFASNMTHLAPFRRGFFGAIDRTYFGMKLKAAGWYFLQPCCPNWPRFGRAFS